MAILCSSNLTFRVEYPLFFCFSWKFVHRLDIMIEKGGYMLLSHLNEIHTTPLGSQRIQRNLLLECNDVVLWCKDKIQKESAQITRHGKNWYIDVDGCKICVNASNYVIITAHSTRNIIKISKHPEYIEKAASWFSSKWHIDVEQYKESMKNKKGIPQWYVMVNEDEKIIAGCGVIENDFHERLDLTPDLCALYVEEKYRNQEIARYLLNYVRNEAYKMGFEKIYLVTDHISFYERYGWKHCCDVKDGRMYEIKTKMEVCYGRIDQKDC